MFEQALAIAFHGVFHFHTRKCSLYTWENGIIGFVTFDLDWDQVKLLFDRFVASPIELNLPGWASFTHEAAKQVPAIADNPAYRFYGNEGYKTDFVNLDLAEWKI